MCAIGYMSAPGDAFGPLPTLNGVGDIARLSGVFRGFTHSRAIAHARSGARTSYDARPEIAESVNAGKRRRRARR
jgi:hypothetical protein